MAFTTHPLVTRPATWLRPQRNQELTASPHPDMSRMFEDMLTAITRFPWVAMPPEALSAAKTEVSETDKEISIVAELPGVSQQDAVLGSSHLHTRTAVAVECGAPGETLVALCKIHDISRCEMGYL